MTSRPFSAHVGGSALLAGGLRVGFEGVACDVRCPKGERCVWAGEAVVPLRPEQGASARTTREQRTTPGSEVTAAVPGLSLQMIGLVACSV